ncbi:MAG: hypothetical protein CL961_00975 [Euryarchaeota archaeon]|nr:hypothetical protein [Euryarchaeota archaeon]
MRLCSLFCLALYPLLYAQFYSNDDFEDNSINADNWSSNIYYGSGVFSENNKQLEYTCGPDFNYRYLEKTASASYDQDFSIVFRTQNTTQASENLNQYAQIGLRLIKESNYTQWLNICHGSYYVSGFGGSRDILSAFYSNGIVQGNLIQPLNIFPQSTLIKVSFDSTTKVFAVFYDENPGNGIEWSLLSSYGVNSVGNGINNLDLGMTTGDHFKIIVYALSNEIEIESGELLIDDFQVANETDTQLSVSEAVSFSFESELGKQYAVVKNTTLEPEIPFYQMGLIKNSTLYELVESSQGSAHFTGTGNQISIVDSDKDNLNAFYKVYSY